MSVANSAQTDIDGDNKGDECDVDIDGDRMDNDWEIRYGLNQRFVGDANGDIDLDGLTNVQEYDEGTDPTNPDSDGD